MRVLHLEAISDEDMLVNLKPRLSGFRLQLAQKSQSALQARRSKTPAPLQRCADTHRSNLGRRREKRALEGSKAVGRLVSGMPWSDGFATTHLPRRSWQSRQYHRAATADRRKQPLPALLVAPTQSAGATKRSEQRRALKNLCASRETTGTGPV